MHADGPQALARRQARAAGYAYGVGTYLVWAAAPLYWRQLSFPALELTAHRVLWAGVALAGLALALGKGQALRGLVADRSRWPSLVLAGALVGSNWLTFVYAVETERVVEASLGYFINPLLSVVFGMVFFRERLRPVQWLAVGFAAAGVALLTYRQGGLPWISLTLAVTFAFYGVIKKRLGLDAIVGTTADVAVVAPFALGYLAYRAGSAQLSTAQASVGEWFLILGTGLLTAVPLVTFGAAATRLPLKALGFLQYIAPSGQFLLAVLVFGELMSPDRLVAFALVWTGLLLFVTEAVRAARQHR